MAFVSDKYKFVFVHITKNGGTSISEALTACHGLNVVGGFQAYTDSGIGQAVPRCHRPYRIKTHDTLNEIEEKYPATSRYTSFAVVRNPWERIFSYYQHKLRRGDEDLQGRNFSECVLANHALALQPQTYWIEDKTRVIRFDSLEASFATLCNELGMECTLRHLNKSSPREYRVQYTAQAQRLVHKQYQYEIHKYGFRF